MKMELKMTTTKNHLLFDKICHYRVIMHKKKQRVHTGIKLLR